MVKKKLSTFSLHNTTETASIIPEEAPLQRRNSIHNVPYVDVNDPNTRQRMERYKEERRSMLRAKYKVEDYMNTEDQDLYKYRRKSSENTKASNEDLSSKNEDLTEDLVILRSDLKKETDDGLIDEDVNVKERAALFGGSKNNRAKSWTTNLITPKNNSKNTRPISDTSAHLNRKMSPGSPSKIRDMAAFFEQQKSWISFTKSSKGFRYLYLFYWFLYGCDFFRFFFWLPPALLSDYKLIFYQKSFCVLFNPMLFLMSKK